MPKPAKAPRAATTRPKHVPQRTCIVCRERNAKRGLTRIVRQPDGGVILDPTGKQNGRGAYVCDAPACWERVVHGQALARALKIDIGGDVLERLRLETTHREEAASQQSRKD